LAKSERKWFENINDYYRENRYLKSLINDIVRYNMW